MLKNIFFQAGHLKEEETLAELASRHSLWASPGHDTFREKLIQLTFQCIATSTHATAAASQLGRYLFGENKIPTSTIFNCPMPPIFEPPPQSLKEASETCFCPPDAKQLPKHF